MSRWYILFVITLVLICLTFVHSNNAIEKREELDFDENQRLLTHYLLYAGNGCSRLNGLTLDFREVREAKGDLKNQFFRSVNNSANSNSCSMVCLERGTHYDHILYPTPQQQHVLGRNEDPMGWILPNCQAAELGFISYLEADASVYWIDQNKQRVNVGMIEPGERNTFWITSYLGHEFEVVNRDDENDVYPFTVRYNSINSIGHYVSGLMVRDVHEEVRSTFEGEWVRAHQVKRTFTPFGFNKGKLPIDLYASMSAYYYNNRNAATVEEWEQKGVFVNWWEQDVFFISMPFKLKRYWQSELKTMVEEWVGVELELTDIYGMRQYEDGARLLTHVDRVNTHACSLIINVAQMDIREPWSIEIYDHADRLHEVNMDEGDIVFYESARCLHGRMQPLRGKSYINLFAHYRPIGDPNWYLKENPVDAPKPVIDIGRCTSNGTKATCDGASVPYLSPKLQTLHNANDLYNFWVEAGLSSTSNVQSNEKHSEL